MCIFRADSRFAPSQWETSLQSKAVFHWLGTNLESALMFISMLPLATILGTVDISLTTNIEILIFRPYAYPYIRTAIHVAQSILSAYLQSISLIAISQEVLFHDALSDDLTNVVLCKANEALLYGVRKTARDTEQMVNHRIGKRNFDQKFRSNITSLVFIYWLLWN